MPLARRLPCSPSTTRPAIPQQEYFADGITEDLIAATCAVQSLLVYARNTMFQYKGKPVDIATLAKQLRADYVVEGSVRRQPDSVRINAQLLDGKTGGHVWSDSYDRALTAGNILNVQDEIATAIAHQISDPHGEISLRETTRSERSRPRSIELYDCLLKYYRYDRLPTVEHHSIARDCLERALKNDPALPNSWWPLSNLYIGEMLGFGTRSELSSFERALAVAEKAVKLAPKSARAHAVHSRALFFVGESQRARDEGEAAIALSPNDAVVLGAAVEPLTQTGLFQRGYDLLMKLKKIDPNYPDYMNYFIFFKYFAERDFAQAALDRCSRRVGRLALVAGASRRHLLLPGRH